MKQQWHVQCPASLMLKLWLSYRGNKRPVQCKAVASSWRKYYCSLASKKQNNSSGSSWLLELQSRDALIFFLLKSIPTTVKSFEELWDKTENDRKLLLLLVILNTVLIKFSHVSVTFKLRLLLNKTFLLLWLVLLHQSFCPLWRSELLFNPTGNICPDSPALMWH